MDSSIWLPISFPFPFLNMYLHQITAEYSHVCVHGLLLGTLAGLLLGEPWLAPAIWGIIANKKIFIFKTQPTITHASKKCLKLKIKYPLIHTCHRTQLVCSCYKTIKEAI